MTKQIKVELYQLIFVFMEVIVEVVFDQLMYVLLRYESCGAAGARPERGDHATTAAVGSCVFYLLNIYFSNEEVSKSVALVRHNMA